MTNISDMALEICSEMEAQELQTLMAESLNVIGLIEPEKACDVLPSLKHLIFLAEDRVRRHLSAVRIEKLHSGIMNIKNESELDSYDLKSYLIFKALDSSLSEFTAVCQLLHEGHYLKCVCRRYTTCTDTAETKEG